MHSLVIFFAACSYTPDPGLQEIDDGDIEAEKDSDFEIEIETDIEIDAAETGDSDTDLDIIPKPDGDIEPEIETDGDTEPDSFSEIEVDGEPETESDHQDPDADPETETEAEWEYEKDVEFDFYNEDLGWEVTLRGELRTSSRNIDRRSYFELYRDLPPGDGSIPTSVHGEENPAPYRIPGGLAYRFVFHQRTGAQFWLRGAVDLNGDGSFEENDLEQEFGYVIGQPFNIATGESKKDIRIYLNYRDPEMGSISGKIIAKTGYLYHKYKVLVYDQAIDIANPPDQSSFPAAKLDPPDLESGSIGYQVLNLASGTYYLYSYILSCKNDDNSDQVWIALPANPLIIYLDGIKDHENLDLDYRLMSIECGVLNCEGDEGNEVGVGKACTYGGGECPEGLICARDLYVDAPGICTIEDCLDGFDCGSNALCGGEEDYSFCVPIRCLDLDEIFCPGDEGNEVGVGKACSIGGGECPEPTICGLDGEGLLLATCVILDCQNSAECGSNALCVPIDNSSTVCVPIRCLEQEDFCPGDDLGNNYSVGLSCTPGGEECKFLSQCLSDWYPGEPSICTYIDCSEDWMCGDEAYCGNQGDYVACFPDRCEPPFPPELCPGGEGNELGVGLACTKGGGECPMPSICPADFNNEELNFCVIFGCDAEEDCGSEAVCDLAGEMGVCFPESCAEIFDCEGDAGNELGVGLTCSPDGDECPQGTACLSDLYPGEYDVCTIPDCTSHEICGSDAACVYDSENARHLCIPYRCAMKYIAELGCAGGAGNELGIGRSCTREGGQCEPGSICLLELAVENPPNWCTILRCNSDAECGSDATCVDMGVANICAPNYCFLIEISRGAQNAGPVCSASDRPRPIKALGKAISPPVFPPKAKLDLFKIGN